MEGIKEIGKDEQFNSQTFSISDVFDPLLDNEIPIAFKEWGIPIPYKVFLSPYFDVKPEGYKTALTTLLKDVNLKDQKHVDLRVPGIQSGMEIYEDLSSVFASEFYSLYSAESDEEHLKTKGSTKILIHPFKLALYLSQYADDMYNNFEIIDVLNEFIDKLILIGILPYIFDNLTYYLKIDPSDGKMKQPNATKFLETIADDLKKKSENLLKLPAFFEDKCYLEITKSEFKKLLTKGGKYNNEEQIFIGINDIDDILSKQLTNKYERLKNENEKNKEKPEIKLVSSWPDEKVIVRRYFKTKQELYSLQIKSERVERSVRKEKIDISSHHWLYKSARILSQSFIRGLSLNTLEFDNEGFMPPPTITDDIDLRPQVWAKTAFNLAADKFVFRKRTEVAQEIIKKAESLEVIYDIDENYRNDWKAYGDILSRIDALRTEVGEYGYEIDLNNADKEDKTKLGIFRTTSYRYQQNVTRYRTIVRHHRRRTRSLFGTKTRRWTTRHRVPYQTTITKTAQRQTPISLEWDPIKTYLNQSVDPSTYTIIDSDGVINSDKTNSSKTALIDNLKKLKGNTELTIENLKNRDKDLRIFSIANNQMLDQYGNDLSSVMQETENNIMRSAMLLLLPVVEVDESGTSNITSYKAIHNPVGFRNSYSIPSVVIHEEIEQMISEETNYYLGPLAHTETLLPGEKRYLNVKTESIKTINSSKSISQTTEQKSKSTSSLQDQARKEVTDIVRKSQQTSWSISAKGSGNFGFAKVGGSASTSGSNSKSSENTINILNDRISKVMSEASQRNELIINTNTTESNQLIEVQEKKIEIENFNTGRSVTHRFHQVMRKYSSKSKIKNLQILITYDEEFIAGYGYRRAELIPINELNSILPDMLESQRSKFIKTLQSKIEEKYSQIKTVNNELIFPENGIALPENQWYVNSGSFIIETDLAKEEILEKYVTDMRNVQIEKINAEKELYSSKAQAIKDGKTVLPMKTDSFNLSTNK